MPPLKGDDGTSPTLGVGKYGVWGESDDGTGVVGTCSGGTGVEGASEHGNGVVGTSEDVIGVLGVSRSTGVYAAYPDLGALGEAGVTGVNDQDRGVGVLGRGEEIGVRGESQRAGVVGHCSQHLGVLGSGRVGVIGFAVDGEFARDIPALYWNPDLAGTGIVGRGDDAGVRGFGVTGVRGESDNGYGVSGIGGDIGVYAENQSRRAYLGTRALAADLYGDVRVHGQLHKDRGGFLIDHPSDPANKYLVHSFVESSEMKNVYDGVAVLDSLGEALVELPDWFEVVNEDLRYQLTPLAAPAPDLHVAAEVSDGAFKIAGGAKGQRVCWQVTGIRKDPIAKARPMQVEQDKTTAERGYYLHPELYGEPDTRGLTHARYKHRDGEAADLDDVAPEARNADPDC